MTNNKCVVCGDIIPEGRQVCPTCEDKKLTDEDIITLTNAYAERMCGKCVVSDLGVCCSSCFITAVKEAVRVIKRQKAEMKEILDEIYKEADQTGLAGDNCYGVRVKVVEFRKKYLGDKNGTHG